MPAPSNIFVHFAQGKPPIQCHTVAEMDVVLDRLHASSLDRKSTDNYGCPLSVSIAIPGYEIGTGLGSAEVFMTVNTDPFDDFLYVAVGDEAAKGDDKMFYGFHQDTYWEPKHLIPVATARDAIRYFVEHQQRSPKLKWEC
jgi:hypothetical protein